jgi:hypothetical protein
VEEFNEKQKDVESVCNPIITKLYQSAGGMPEGKLIFFYESKLPVNVRNRNCAV